MLKRILFLLLAPIVGGAAGFGLAYLLFSGWLRGWQPVADPPEKAAHILALNGASVWVQAASGKIYNNPNSDTCLASCWTEVPAVPQEFPPETDLKSRLAQSCGTPPPILGVVESRGDCKVRMWWDENTVYVLRANGRLAAWRYGSGGEWTAVGYLLLILSGAVLFFLIAAIILFIRWLSRRGREKAATGAPA